LLREVETGELVLLENMQFHHCVVVDRRFRRILGRRVQGNRENAGYRGDRCADTTSVRSFLEAPGSYCWIPHCTRLASYTAAGRVDESAGEANVVP
jgi:hypothetical protein